MALSERFSEALVYACTLHREQVRKGANTPYIAHLLSVCGLAIENGGDEDQAIAAVLHDAIEDQGGTATEVEIRLRFGDRVGDIVRGCTDSDITPKPPWRARKEAYIAHLAHTSNDVRFVSCCDKLHNARAIVQDFRAHGDEVWDRFTAGRDGVLWYYRSLANAFLAFGNTPLTLELARTVDLMEQLAAR